jgi:protoporphyrinogen/coproporphyrinogen III oxidase
LSPSKIPPSSADVAIIGAGISGLCTAYWLHKAGLRVAVLEQSQRCGGTMITEKQDGFLIDLGPNSALETSETLKELIRELGLEDSKVYGNEASNKRYILKGGRLHPVPMSPGSFITSGLFSLRAKLRLLREPFIGRSRDPHISLADFVRHRLGREFLDYAINPFVAGVYAGDPSQLGTAAAFPKLYALEQNYGSLIRGAIAGARERKKRKEVAKDRARLFSFREGMEVFPKALAATLGDAIRYGVEVTALKPAQDGWELTLHNGLVSENLQANTVVSAVPSNTLGKLLIGLEPEAAATLSGIPYPPVAVVFMGFRAQAVTRPLDGFGFLIPALEQKQILGSIWSSTIFPGRAPDGHVAFTSFVGGARQPENARLDDAALEQLVLRDLDAIVGLKGLPVVTRILKWPRAIPQYGLTYTRIQQLFTDLEARRPGLYIAGNIRRGISVGDSVLCARETADRILAHFQ